MQDGRLSRATWECQGDCQGLRMLDFHLADRGEDSEHLMGESPAVVSNTKNPRMLYHIPGA